MHPFPLYFWREKFQIFLISRLKALRPLAGELGMLLRIIIILSLGNFLACLKQINHWYKPTQYEKQTKQKKIAAF